MNQDRLSQVRTLEKELGTPFFALAKIGADSARVDDGDLAKIQSLEQELGAVLVAVDG